MGKKGKKKLKPPQEIHASDRLPHLLPVVSGAKAQLRKSFLIIIILIASNLFIYWQVRSFKFIGWDDPLYVTDNTQVSKGISWEGFKWALTSGHAANWHPLTWISHMVDVQLFGVAPGPIHFINLLLHIGNSLLLFWLLIQMTSAWGQSAFVAALFAVHPLHVESVAWVAERKDVLSTTFFLLTILAYTAYIRNRRFRNYLLVSGLFLLALMAKPMVVTLPLLLLLLDLWPLGRALPQGSDRKIWRRLVIEKIPLLAMAGIVSLVTIVVQRRGGTVAGFQAFPWGSRLENAVVSFMAYLQKMLWPVDLSPFYPYQQLSVLTFGASILGLVGISILAIRFRLRHPFFLFGWSWYVIALLPVIGLIQVGDQARGDRYTYLPLIGIFVIIAWGMSKLLPQEKSYKFGMGIAAGLVICVLSISSRVQAGYWRDAFTLWGHAVESTANSAHAHVNLGLALMDRGEIGQAIAHYKEALRLNPDFAEAHNALGVALLAHNLTSEAALQFDQALRLRPTLKEAQANMGIILARQGKQAEAISHFTQALMANPHDAKLHQNIGLVLAEMGRNQEAATHYSEAIRLKPDFADPYIKLGNLLLNQGQVDQAIERYKTAIRIEPNSADAHNNLGIALLNQGCVKEAMNECNEVLRINPGSATGHNCLGNVLTRADRGEEAIREYRQALQIDPNCAEAYSNLATVLINRSQDEEAITFLREALKIKPKDTQARINLAIALINNGRVSEAIDHLKEVLLTQPDNQAAKETLEIALQRQRSK